MPKRRMRRHAVTQPLDESIRLIPLTQGQNAIVDAADFEWLNQWNWHAHWVPDTKSFVAGRDEHRKSIYMHRFITNCDPNKEVDHKDHNTLNNRRNNLRPCTHSQNTANAKKKRISAFPFKGINFYKRKNKWRVSIHFEKKRRYVGSFKTPEEAARAYDEAAIALFGEFAHLNFPTTAQ
jgi:hypothetical protein